MKLARKGFVLAVTGGMSSGKSTLASVLRRHGAAYISLDEVAHSLYEPGTPVYGRLVAEFGRGITGPGGIIDRGRLGRLAFNDVRALARLDAIVHPALRREAAEALARMRRLGGLVVVESGPILFKLGLGRIADGVVLVRAGRRERLRRLMAGRGLSRKDAEARLNSSERAEKALGLGLRSIARRMEVDASGPAERMGPAAVRILQVLKRWK